MPRLVDATPRPETSVRTAQAAEYPAIQALLQRAYAPVLAAMAANDADSFRHAIDGMVSRYGQQGSWFVTESDHGLSGCVAFFPPQSVEHRLFHASWAHIQLLGVDPAHARRGLATALMRHCLSAAHAAGATTFALQTSALMRPARALYDSLGFVVETTLAPAFGHPTYLYLRREN